MNPMTLSIRRYGGPGLRASSRRLALVALVGAIAVAGCQTGYSLSGPIWGWTAVQETNPTLQAATPDPAKYTIEFLADGAVKVKADCNSLSGTYKIGLPLDLTINVPVTTIAACENPSLDHIYLELLSRVATYSTANGKLNLDLADGGGALQFQAPGS